MAKVQAVSANQAIHWRCGGESVWALPYGEAPVDLHVCLDEQARPVTVTRLLTGFLRDGEGRAPGADAVWAWDLTRRLQGLLAIAAASLGSRQALETRCSNPECGEDLDLDVELADFCEVESATAASCEPEPGRTLRVRVPTGADQLAWLERWPFEPPEWTELVATLVEAVDDEPPAPGWRPKADWGDCLGEVLARADALTDLQLETECVACGQAVTAAVDLEDYVLRRLRHRQAHLLDEVHALASTYHWSEADIFALPGERRRAYLERIEGVERW